MVVSSSRMLLARCVDSPTGFLETTREEMAGNVLKSHFMCFDLQTETFLGRDVFCTLSRLFVRPGFRLLCARLAVHYLTV